MKKRLTKWFGPDVKPTIPGVYDVKDVGQRHAYGAQYWNGHHWCRWGTDREDAAQSAKGGKSLFQRINWRGLAEKPE